MNILTDYLNHARHSHVLTIFDCGFQTNFYLKHVKRVEVYCITYDPEIVRNMNEAWYSKPVHSNFPREIKEGYFFPGCDIMDHDVSRLSKGNPLGIHNITSRKNVGAVNTLGYLKDFTKDLEFVSVFKGGGGLYTTKKDYRTKFFHRLHIFDANEWIRLLVSFSETHKLDYEKFRIIHICYEADRIEFPFPFAELYLEEEGFLCVDERWCAHGFVEKYLGKKFQYIGRDGRWVIYQRRHDYIVPLLENNRNERYITSSEFVLWRKMLEASHVLPSDSEILLRFPSTNYEQAQTFGNMLGLSITPKNNGIFLKRAKDYYYHVSNRFDSFGDFIQWTKEHACHHTVICTTLYQSEEYLEDYFGNLQRLTNWITSKGQTWTVVFCYSKGTDNTIPRIQEYCATLDNFVYMESPRFAKYRSVDIAIARNHQMRMLHEYFSDFLEYMMVLDANYVNHDVLDTKVLDNVLRYRDDWDAISFQRKDYYDIWALSYDPYYLSCWSFEYQCIETMKNDIVERLARLSENELMECVSAFCGFMFYSYPKFRDCWYSGYFELERFFDYNIEQNIFILQEQGIRFRLTNPECIVNYSEVTNDCEHKYFHLDAIEKHGARIRISPQFLFTSL